MAAGPSSAKKSRIQAIADPVYKNLVVKHRKPGEEFIIGEYPIGKGDLTTINMKAAPPQSFWADLDLERGKDVAIKHKDCKLWLPEHFAYLTEKVLDDRVRMINKFVEISGTDKICHLPDGIYFVTRERIYRPIGLNPQLIDILAQAEQQHRDMYKHIYNQQERAKAAVEDSIRKAKAEQQLCETPIKQEADVDAVEEDAAEKTYEIIDSGRIKSPQVGAATSAQQEIGDQQLEELVDAITGDVRTGPLSCLQEQTWDFETKEWLDELTE